LKNKTYIGSKSSQSQEGDERKSKYGRTQDFNVVKPHPIGETSTEVSTPQNQNTLK